jgi:hypothetical protein
MEVFSPQKYNEMADEEHLLSDLKGHPVTMLKDQSNLAKEKAKTEKYSNLVFLKPHPDYPENKCLADMPKVKIEPLMECNGFCGTNDLNPRTSTEQEINFEETEPLNRNSMNFDADTIGVNHSNI